MSKSKPKTANPEGQWFGFRRVDPAGKAALVKDVFDKVAGRYDLMNDLMSGGMHRLWKDTLVRMIDPKPGQVMLDVAGGTGDVALRCYRRTEGKARIMVCDYNPAMLEQGKEKAINHGVLNGIEWIAGNAEDLPLPSRSVDIYNIAFGLRNVTRIDKALQEAARVLKPGGRFFCLEFSPGVTPALKPLYEKYCMQILPWLGERVANDRPAYQYLAESIQQFPLQAALAERMESAGLSQAKWFNMSGGVAVIHSAWKL